MRRSVLFVSAIMVLFSTNCTNGKSLKIKLVKTITKSNPKTCDNFGAILDINREFIIIGTKNSRRGTTAQNITPTDTRGEDKRYLYKHNGSFVKEFTCSDSDILINDIAFLEENLVAEISKDKKTNFCIFDIHGKPIKSLFNDFFDASELANANIKVKNGLILITIDLLGDRDGVYVFDINGKNLFKIEVPKFDVSGQFGLSVDCNDNVIIISSTNNNGAFLYDRKGIFLKKILIDKPRLSFGESVLITNKNIVVSASGHVHFMEETPFGILKELLLPDQNIPSSLYLFNSNGGLIKTINNKLFDPWGLQSLSYNYKKSLFLIGTGTSKDCEKLVLVYNINGKLLTKIHNPNTERSGRGDYFGHSIVTYEDILLISAPEGGDIQGIVYLYKIED